MASTNYHENESTKVESGSDSSHHPHQYTEVARILHWIVVALLIAQYILAWTMPNADKPKAPVGLIGWHVSLGILILCLMVVRLGWRMLYPGPPPPGDIPRFMQGFARLTHVMLYTLLFLVPLLGWAMASSRGWAVKPFGLFAFPSLVGATGTDSPLTVSLTEYHMLAANVLLYLIPVHIAGALFHAFVLRDRTLQRIIPGVDVSGPDIRR